MTDVTSRSAAEFGTGARGETPAVPLPGGQAEPHVTEARLPAAEASEVIEPGRMLALADFTPPSLSAGERLVRLAYGLGLRGSLIGALRKPSKRRLLATVASPLPGDRVAGTALRAGHFLIHGIKLPIAQAELAGIARMPQPMERYVHGFTWLTDLEAAGTREQVKTYFTVQTATSPRIP